MIFGIYQMFLRMRECNFEAEVRTFRKSKGSMRRSELRENSRYSREDPFLKQYLISQKGHYFFWRLKVFWPGIQPEQ